MVHIFKNFLKKKKNKPKRSQRNVGLKKLGMFMRVISYNARLSPEDQKKGEIQAILRRQP